MMLRFILEIQSFTYCKNIRIKFATIEYNLVLQANYLRWETGQPRHSLPTFMKNLM